MTCAGYFMSSEHNEHLKPLASTGVRRACGLALVVDGKLVLRAAILSYRTHFDEIVETLDVLKQKVQQLEQE